MLHKETLPTPTGPFHLVTDGEGTLIAAGWETPGHEGLTPPARPSAARQAVEAYFAGAIDALDRLATAAKGTAFQHSVWDALRRIPAGQTASYGQIATAIGRPTAVRAVGLANGANPIALIVPCHRVIGADGSLTGYGGGLERKRWLIEHERAHARRAAA